MFSSVLPIVTNGCSKAEDSTAKTRSKAEDSRAQVHSKAEDSRAQVHSKAEDSRANTESKAEDSRGTPTPKQKIREKLTVEGPMRQIKQKIRGKASALEVCAPETRVLPQCANVARRRSST